MKVWKNKWLILNTVVGWGPNDVLSNVFVSEATQ
jgi:hypothetical protein